MTVTYDFLRLSIQIAYYVLVSLVIVLILARKREPEAALAWILAVIFLPMIGIILFFLAGVRKIPTRLKRKLYHRNEFNKKFSEQDILINPIFDSFHTPDVVRSSGPEFIPTQRWSALNIIADKLSDSRKRWGNSIELLADGEKAFDAIFTAIEAAKDHVHIEKFIFRYDQLGKRLVDLLIKKIKQNVEVRVLVDAFGSVFAWTLLARLRQAGGHAAVFMQLLPLFKRFTPNFRNHRKIVICDGSVGFFGGLNIGDEYLGHRKRLLSDWCDVHLKVAGPAVLDLQRIFAEDWDFATGEFLSEERYFRDIPAIGSAPIQIVSSGPDDDLNAIRSIYFSAMTHADQSLLVASPYLVPDLAIREALISAALRGVKVSILTQGLPPDYWLPHLASTFFWEDYLTAGIRIFLYQGGMMHAKFIVADNAWASVGSANIDNRSLALDFELVGLLDRRDEVEVIANWFEDKIKQSIEVDLEKLKKRSIFRRIAERGALLFAPLL